MTSARPRLSRHCLVALQVLHKAPIKEPKHIEHVLNERRTQVPPLLPTLDLAMSVKHALS